MTSIFADDNYERFRDHTSTTYKDRKHELCLEGKILVTTNTLKIVDDKTQL